MRTTNELRGALALRPRVDRDMEPLADLWVASWQEAMPQIDFLARRPWLLDHIPALEARGAQTICAVDATGRLVGFVTIDPATAYLDQLAVAPTAKGKGVARRLLDEALGLSPKGLGLDVNTDNSRALRFYMREGFEPIGEGVNPMSGLRTLRLFRRSSATGAPRIETDGRG